MVTKLVTPSVTSMVDTVTQLSKLHNKLVERVGSRTTSLARLVHSELSHWKPPPARCLPLLLQGLVPNTENKEIRAITSLICTCFVPFEPGAWNHTSHSMLHFWDTHDADPADAQHESIQGRRYVHIWYVHILIMVNYYYSPTVA